MIRRSIGDYRRLSSIIVDYRRLSSIIVDYRGFSSIRRAVLRLFFFPALRLLPSAAIARRIQSRDEADKNAGDAPRSFR